MDIQLFRIDDRLIHGQVVIGWAKPLKSNCILLCDDNIANNEWERDLYMACAPEDIITLVYTIQQTSEYLLDSTINKDKTIVIVQSPMVIIELLKTGVKPDLINVGGIHCTESRKQFLPYIFLSPVEIDDFRYLLNKNISIYCQDVPGGKKYPIQEIIDK